MTRMKSLSCAGILLLSGVFLNGCQSHRQDSQVQSLVTSEAVPVPPVVAQPAPVESDNKKPPVSCLNELASLQKISPKNYAVRKTAYDRLVVNASQYEGIREGVNSSTQDTVDALYKYKMNILCADINHDVMQALIRKGESAK